MILEASQDSLPFQDQLKGLLSPSWWDSPPIAANLFGARGGFKDEFGDLLGGIISSNPNPNNKIIKSLQSQIANQLKPRMVCCHVLKLLPIRFGSAGIEHKGISFENIPSVLKRCTRHEALRAIKLLSNAVNSFWRRHEGCRFFLRFWLLGSFG